MTVGVGMCARSVVGMNGSGASCLAGPGSRGACPPALPRGCGVPHRNQAASFGVDAPASQLGQRRRPLPYGVRPSKAHISLYSIRRRQMHISYESVRRRRAPTRMPARTRRRARVGTRVSAHTSTAHIGLACAHTRVCAHVYQLAVDHAYLIDTCQSGQSVPVLHRP